VIRKLSVSLLTLVAIVSTVNIVCQAQSQTFLTRHTRDAVVNGEAQSVGRLPATQSLRFDVVLALRHQPELDNFLQEVYDPSSASYRQFVTVEEFTERFGPSQEDYDAVLAFAKANGFTVVGGSRDGFDVQLKGSVASIEKAFHVTMGTYQHPSENRTFFAPDREPTANLSVKLWHISGLDNYSIPRPMLQHRNLRVKGNAVKGSCPGGEYCGSDMRAAYYGGTALTGAGQNLGLLEYLGYDIADLNTYFKNVGQTDNVPVTGVSTDGSSLTCIAAQGCDDREQILDMTQAISMAPGLTGLYVFVGGTDTAMLSSMTTHKPLVTSIGSSWTWQPSDPSTDDPFFKKFAAQGQNYFQAAGDSGAYTAGSQYVFPGDDAYVTVVGGTDLQVTKAGGPWSSETAWPDGGGGVYTPDAIPIPTWQQLPGVITTQNHGSKTLRNSPDVSAEANFDFYTCADQEACQGGWGGTSFAAPMWAGFMALVNQQAVENGNPTLGFVNPAIYNLGVSSGYSAAFHDITSGSNGEPATAGYDLATGWGSPIGNGLITALAGSGGGGGPTVTVSPTSLTWGNTVVGATATKKAVTLTNTGTSTLTITSIAASGDFGLTTSTKPCGSTLAAGKSCTIDVTFTPTQTGTRTGTLTLTDNSPSSPQTVALSGTGTVQATLTPASETFATEKVGTSSPAKTLTLTNKQAVSLTGIKISITGDFSVSATTCSTSLAAKAKCTISVVFKPTATGARTGILSVADSAVGSPQTSSLKGTGK
jgi:subtilase family serine protease